MPLHHGWHGTVTKPVFWYGDCGYLPMNLRDAAAVQTSWRNAVVQLIKTPRWKTRHHADEDLRTLLRQSPHQFYGVQPQFEVIARRLNSHPHEATAAVSLYSVPSYKFPLDTFGRLALGARISVFWAGDGLWFDGFVTEWTSKPVSQDNATIVVVYDDGDTQEHKLFGEIFQSGEDVPPIRWKCPSLRQHNELVPPQVLPIHEALAMHGVNDNASRPFLDPRVVPLLLQHHNAHMGASFYWLRDEADEADPRERMREGLAYLALRLRHFDLAASIRSMVSQW